MPRDSETPEGWVREEIVAGMGTVGICDHFEDFVGMGSGLKCRHCEHFVPIDAVGDRRCPSCDRATTGTVIMGRQDVTVMHPEGWFDATAENENGDNGVSR